MRIQTYQMYKVKIVNGTDAATKIHQSLEMTMCAFSPEADFGMDERGRKKV
jgi:hypothetical protein